MSIKVLTQQYTSLKQIIRITMLIQTVYHPTINVILERATRSVHVQTKYRLKVIYYIRK